MQGEAVRLLKFHVNGQVTIRGKSGDIREFTDFEKAFKCANLNQIMMDDISTKLSQIEDAWACGLNLPADLELLKSLLPQTTQGADRHRAICLIELIESPHNLRNDGEIERLLRHRNARQWMARLVPLPSKQVQVIRSVDNPL